MHRILLILPYGSLGGMERLALTFYHHYKSLGHDVKILKIVGLAGDMVSVGDDEIVLSNKDFHQMSTPARVFFYLRLPWMIRQAVKKHKITHSVAFGDMANMASSLSGTNEFKVASIHSLKSVEFLKATMLNKVFRFGYRNTYRYFDKVVCISNAVKCDLLQNCGFAFPDRLQVIYNPHDIPMIRRLAEEPLDDASEKELFAHDVVLFVGRYSMAKAPWHLVKSFSLLVDRNPESRLVFIGDGSIDIEMYTRKLTERMGLEDKITFLGKKSNPYKYIKAARCVALSSYFEGTPNVIVESLALGVPVVSTNCTAGIGELMQPVHEPASDKKIFAIAGIITPPFLKGVPDYPQNDDIIPEEVVFSEALETALCDPLVRERLQSSADSLLTKFDTADAARRYLEPIDSLEAKK